MTDVVRNVIQSCRLRKISLMTLITICVDKLIIAVRVARLARYRNMRSRQRELRCAMVKRCRLPCCHGMTLQTRLRKIVRLVIGICCAREIRPVAVNAVRGKVRILVVLMAVRALQGPMRSHERKFGIVVCKR